MCRICSAKTTENVVIFADKSLAKCQQVLSIRVENNLKYKSVVLPVELSAKDGYHRSCYRSFTALNAMYTKQQCKSRKSGPPQDLPSLPMQTSDSSISTDMTVDIGSLQGSSDSPMPTTELTSQKEKSRETKNTTSDKDSLCTFCDKNYKKSKGKAQVLIKTQKDGYLLKKLEGVEQVLYHKVCKNAYFNNRIVTLEKGEDSNISTWHAKRIYYGEAYKELCTFVEENVIKGNNCYFLSYLYAQFMDLLKMAAEKNSDLYNNLASIQYLETKIIETFQSKIKIINISQKKVVIPSNVQLEDLSFNLLEDEEVLQKAANILRREILDIKKEELPRNLTAESLIKGECTIPPRLLKFYQDLIVGSDARRREGWRCKRRVKSLSQDLIYAVSNGKIKTSKHIRLGIVLKSQTSSRKIVDIVNRHGHCCSYNVIEELEAEAAFTSMGRSRLCPGNRFISKLAYWSCI